MKNRLRQAALTGVLFTSVALGVVATTPQIAFGNCSTGTSHPDCKKTVAPEKPEAATTLLQVFAWVAGLFG